MVEKDKIDTANTHEKKRHFHKKYPKGQTPPLLDHNVNNNIILTK